VNFTKKTTSDFNNNPVPIKSAQTN